MNKQNVQVFDNDVQQGGSYVYTNQERLSSRLANSRMSEAVRSCYDFADRRVLDLGCGGPPVT